MDEMLRSLVEFFIHGDFTLNLALMGLMALLIIFLM
jgi:hypothetical protein